MADDKLKLKSSQGEIFEVEPEVATMSTLIKNMVEDSGTDEEIPLPNVKTAILSKVIDYCKYHKDSPPEEIQKPLKSTNLVECGVSEWDNEYVNIEQEVLFELILAANYLDIKSLLDLTCAKVASMIKGKNTEEIRKQFNIVNDFTPEEEAQASVFDAPAFVKRIAGAKTHSGRAALLHRIVLAALQPAFRMDCSPVPRRMRLHLAPGLNWPGSTSKEACSEAQEAMPCLTRARRMAEDKLKLKSSQGEIFEVEPEVATMSTLIKNMVEDSGTDEEIPLPNVKTAILSKVIDYCKYHKDSPPEEIQKPLKSTNLVECGVSEWDNEYVNIEQEVLFELILAANYLDIKSLLDLTCAKVASMIKGKNTEEIRKQFNIVNDFTPEEEAQVREENRWCEDA
ncbi:unnamed protein product [Effrenium voratum]|uniref:S-phase kinase-associated protein 1 n=1 Tax=Effrenium voratum TaxID=2562239 RepID=A0AA36N7J3_9DINO|nr:unnamed protein product [Effrenium voratum]